MKMYSAPRLAANLTTFRRIRPNTNPFAATKRGKDRRKKTPKKMDYQLNHQLRGGAGGVNSLYSSSSDRNNSSSSTPISAHHHQHNSNNNHQQNDPMQSWWESVSKARTRIHSLLVLLSSDFSDSDSLTSLADSDRPARSLLESPDAYAAVSSSLTSPASGSGDDPLCHWLYDTFQSSDSDLRLVVLSFVPLLTGLYLSRLHSSSSIDASTPSLAGFEAVLLSLYASETKSRGGKPLLISIPDLSQPSLYHNPSPVRHSGSSNNLPQSHTQFSSPSRQSVGVLSPALEPQLAIKSTKRGCIVGVALDFYYKHISQMPNWSKFELCRFATSWAGVDCPCARSLDPNHDHDFDPNDQEDAISCTAFENEDRSDYEIHNVADDMGKLDIQQEATKGLRIPLPWEMLQPVLRILGHCLLAPLIAQEIRNEAGMAVRRLYARASHDLFPQGILATRSLIRLDNRARSVAEAVALTNSSSNVNTPSKSKKPEVLLVSK